MSRCDSAAIVSNTSELLPEPETPVNTVSRRFGISMLTSLRLFTRAPCTRIRSWRSATRSAADCVSVFVAVLIVSPLLRAPSRSRLPSPGARSNQIRAPLVLLRFGPWSRWAPATRRARRGVRPTSGRRASARDRASHSPRARPGCGAVRLWNQQYGVASARGLESVCAANRSPAAATERLPRRPRPRSRAALAHRPRRHVLALVLGTACVVGLSRLYLDRLDRLDRLS